jgi:hypothetical protein
MPTRRELYKEYRSLTDLYEKAVVTREDAQNEYAKATTEQAIIEGGSPPTDEEPERQAELDEADDHVRDTSETLQSAKEAEGVAYLNREKFRLQHGDIAENVDKQDDKRFQDNVQQQMDKLERQDEHYGEIEPSTDSPAKNSPFTQAAGMVLAGHLAAHAPVADIEALQQQMANPPAIVQQYDASNPEASCAPQAQLTKPSENPQNPERNAAHDDLDENAQQLNEALEKGGEKKEKMILPPTEKSARELADTKSSPEPDDPNHHMTRY